MTIAASAASSQMTEESSHIRLDAGNFAIFDSSYVDLSTNTNEKESALLDLSQKAIQKLVAHLFALPAPERMLASEAAHTTIVAIPNGNTPLPRSKPVPKPAEPTKWEQFAKAKGIKKRSRLQRHKYSEAQKEWLPRHGYGSEKQTNRKASKWCTELKPGEALPDDM